MTGRCGEPRMTANLTEADIIARGAVHLIEAVAAKDHEHVARILDLWTTSQSNSAYRAASTGHHQGKAIPRWSAGKRFFDDDSGSADYARRSAQISVVGPLLLTTVKLLLASAV